MLFAISFPVLLRLLLSIMILLLCVISALLAIMMICSIILILWIMSSIRLVSMILKLVIYLLLTCLFILLMVCVPIIFAALMRRIIVMADTQLSFSDFHFPTQFIRPLSPYSEHGTTEHITYQAHFDDTGHYELVESGKINTYEEIQSHKDGVDIHILLERYAAGDVDVLSRVQGAYFDATLAPKTYAEMLNNLVAAEQSFYQLPVEVRAQYGHSFEVWLSSLTPQTVTPQNTNPQTVTPQNVTPQNTNPQTVNPQNVTPQNTNP